MECLKFTLSGPMACFRKPETNSSVYLSYGNIHKVALIGLLGAIVGYSGYNQSGKDNLPEFYSKLRNLQISIAPPKKNIQQKINRFNNSTSFASQEDGGNLIVAESMLLNPCWDIYILDDGTPEYNQIKLALQNQDFVYIPYLGRNDYHANISNFEILEASIISEGQVVEFNSLFIGNLTDCIHNNYSKKDFLYVEKLPVALDTQTYHYVYENFILTTELLAAKDNAWSVTDNNLMFF